MSNTVVVVLSVSHSTLSLSSNLSLFLSVLFALIKRIPSSLCGLWNGNYSIYKYPDSCLNHIWVWTARLSPAASPFLHLHIDHCNLGSREHCYGAMPSFNWMEYLQSMTCNSVWFFFVCEVVNPVHIDLSPDIFKQ